MTERLTPADLDRAAGLLRSGALVAFPTETVYGLGADATSDAAVAAIFAAKERPRFNPLIIHVVDSAAARRLVVFNDLAERLAERFWPGPLTLVLPRAPDCPVSLLASAGRDGAERFVRRTLGELLEPSSRHLLVTLTQMAEHAWNIRAVAEALGKHENTIRYRVGRIEEVSGLAIRTDALAQMEARMALLVMDVQRRVGARED